MAGGREQDDNGASCLESYNIFYTFTVSLPGIFSMVFVNEETIASMHMTNLQNHPMSVDTTWLGTARMV